MEETNNGEIIESKKRAHMPMRLVCAVKYYDWGVESDNSQVARLCSFNSKSNIDPDDTYAEFWTGTHESEPSFLDPGVVSLKIWILDFLDVLGDQVIFLSCSRLVRLFVCVVLSIGEGIVDFQSQPSLYKDENHKPEMALSLTEL
ncbi:hypothetical protein JRO89_XS05G0259700 [Xanthoceras sorbifolium]|uniref:Phosphomannose isomerase type I catalytic domain-containing protein n=1 Tax=Xanthoceras sorbifolium TaxID=99658 RepID=A0ABQ8I3B7_9ROSI|nr:hypothetical protein JRO89_XS05G0259700 [Xanthoceras sorbifolium]